MATSVAIFVALKESGKLDEHSYDCVAGHSLGEYSALVCSKSLDFYGCICKCFFSQKDNLTLHEAWTYWCTKDSKLNKMKTFD